MCLMPQGPTVQDGASDEKRRGMAGGRQTFNTKWSRSSKFDLDFQSRKHISQYMWIEHILFSKLLTWFKPMTCGLPFVLLPGPCEYWGFQSKVGYLLFLL